jgi:hypothetical protein
MLETTVHHKCDASAEVRSAADETTGPRADAAVNVTPRLLCG